nr:NACHT domain-containing protein [Duganella sp. FT27W]
MNFIPECKRVLITDTAGMGKSTLMRYLLVQCIRSNFAVPVFIELRHLSQTRTILDLLQGELNYEQLDGTKKFTASNIAEILKNGELVFFFDGYDEIPFKDREAVTKDVKNFVETYPRNCYALTSRAESGLAAFPSFTQFRIRPLKKSESFALIKKYDKDGTRSEKLIARLKGKELRAVHEFLENPLLTTLLYRCFEYKQNVPEKKHIFYRQVFDALFDWHDSSKDGYNTREKKSKLDLDSFHRVLRVMGFISTLNGEIEGDKDKILEWIREAKSVCVGLNFSESDFLEDLTRAVPVFSRDGVFYKWSHKSLAEYFAAQYICTEGKIQQGEVFKHIFNENILDKFYNLIDQVYDLDQPAFRKYFSLPFATAAMQYRNVTYKGLPPSISADEIELRKSSAFAGRVVIAKGAFPTDEEITEDHSGKREVYNFKISLSYVKLPNLKDPLVVIRLFDNMCIIGDILFSKKDPLVLDKSKCFPDDKMRPIKGLGKKKSALQVNDNNNSVLNLPGNFEAVTRVLLRSPMGLNVDFEACKYFCDNFSDEQSRTHFTKNLLSKITNDVKSENKDVIELK